MLQIRNIKKEYRTGSLVQKALDDVSLNFRDNEFVAILGPSGSGKTTLLNVVGGLDRYDSGDLIINGVSTKNYSDRDWDSYRNHTIGFVFQSYNLIPHQTVLANVELALTIGGMSREERRAKAEEALRKVGLGDQMHKKPTQMSGGQMQRVAIARALVTDPDILLADEPTGALDSETSLQVMELIKEIAADRLVIMVTHNPELAQEYATRIVELKDGKIQSDSDPFVVDEGEGTHRNLGKASMSFLTALALSFNNLKTKLTRTVLVAFAGSIGIIGIALILSLSTGVNKYIDDIEANTLNEYPLQITETGFDLSSMFQGEMGSGEEGEEGESEGKSQALFAPPEEGSAADGESQNQVREFQIMSSMFSMLEKNDLKSLKKYLESEESGVYDHVKAIEYFYGVDPLIYYQKGKYVRQVHPDQTSQAMGIGYTGTSSLFAQMSNYNVFHQLPENQDLYMDQYEVKAGRWPEKYNECVLVTSRFGSISDLALYAMGLKDNKELDERTEAFSKGEAVDVDEEERLTFDYEDLVGISFKLVNNSDTYVYNEKQEVWTSKADNKKFMRKLVKKGEDLTIVGVVRPKEGVKITPLQEDIYYTPELLRHVVELAADSSIVKEQLANDEINVITGKPFGEGGEDSSMEDLFDVDEDALQNAFSFDTSAFKKLSNAFSGMDMKKMDLKNAIDPKAFDGMMPKMKQKDIEKIITAAVSGVTAQDVGEVFEKILNGYMKYASKDPTTNWRKLGDAFRDYLQSEDAQKIITEHMQKLLEANADKMFTQEELQQIISDVMAGYAAYAIEQGITDPTDLSHITEYLQSDAAKPLLDEKQQMIVAKLMSFEVSEEDAEALAKELSDGYTAYAQAAGNVPDLTKLQASLSGYMSSKKGKKLIYKQASSLINTKKMNKALEKVMGKYSGNMTKAVQTVMAQVMTAMGKQIQKNLSNIDLDLSNAFSFDADAFAEALGLNMTEDEMMELLAAMMNTGANTYESNLKSFGYANFNEPMEIDIYPKDFEHKDKVKEILDDYNDDAKDRGDDEKVISYTDIVATLMNSVTDIIDAISYVLIAFVSISLIVSSIMIGVITYISVLERRKEIGILRAIGASKWNISEVFNAETFIIGALAGLFGIGISLLLLIPINMVIDHVTTANVVAQMPPVAAILLVLLSIVLTFIGGIIPSRAAAKSDPVTALRVE